MIADLTTFFGLGFLLGGMLWVPSFAFRTMKKAVDMSATD